MSTGRLFDRNFWILDYNWAVQHQGLQMRAEEIVAQAEMQTSTACRLVVKSL